ncbi:MAG: hypothetical protein MJK15_00645 [Colwellia sp.]|nr:hypothetical protein [Colwellia sp.]
MQNKRMKEILGWVSAILLILAVLFAILFSVRAFNAATVQHKVITPVPGIQCVIVSTTDGASTACWKVEIEAELPEVSEVGL